MSSKQKDYNHIKGDKAESYVHELASKTFLSDWCYLNPKLPNGKELCDLLVIYDDIAIIWQIKDLKLRKSGNYKRAEIEKNLMQVAGARRQLFDLKTELKLENSRRKIERFNSTIIKDIYLISVILGEGEVSSNLVDEIKNHTVHSLTKESLEIILNELDTIKDFTLYFKEKEKLINSCQNIIILGGEKELLAFYLVNKRNFSELAKADTILIEKGSWEKLLKRPEYIEKNKQNEISYAWDGIIDRTHEGSSNYELIGRELARPNRFQRRALSKTYFDAYLTAGKDKTHDLLRRVYLTKGVTYCFLFQDDLSPNKESRKNMLQGICLVARDMYKQNNKVIGIATEKTIQPECSYDFCLIDKTEWDSDDQIRSNKIQKEFNIFLNPDMQIAHEEEYPLPSDLKK